MCCDIYGCKLTFANTLQVGNPVNNRVEDAKALIMGPPGSVVILRFTRGDTLKEHTHASFEVSLVRESVKVERE